ncbi:MAG TPA: double-strand break repair protein AddB, partial [Rhizobiales bacterium]|nr:double-strand break repair protein AddB [Hyphomicrobiales bacterium]
FVDIARWFVMQEETRRADIAVTHVEKAASLEVPGITPPFILTARADRIDIHKDGTASIIDYKTGAPPTGKMLEAGLAPQLPLEAALLAAGGFAGLPEAQARDLIYMKLSGGAPAGELRHVSRKTSAMELAQRAMTELAGAIALYDLPQTPYVVRRMAQFENRLGDYDHLARTREWRLLMTEAQET